MGFLSICLSRSLSVPSTSHKLNAKMLRVALRSRKRHPPLTPAPPVLLPTLYTKGFGPFLLTIPLIKKTSCAVLHTRPALGFPRAPSTRTPKNTPTTSAHCSPKITSYGAAPPCASTPKTYLKKRLPPLVAPTWHSPHHPIAFPSHCITAPPPLRSPPLQSSIA